MNYLVTVCDGCGRVALTPAPRLGEPIAPCAACQQATRVVPSRMHEARECKLFEELSATLSEAGLSATEAQMWTQRITRGLAQRKYLECWEDLTTRFPPLLARQLVLGGNVHAHIQALQSARTIFEALANTRRSGMMPSLNATLPEGAKSG